MRISKGRDSARAIQANGNSLLLVHVSPEVPEQLEETRAPIMRGAENVFAASKTADAGVKAYERARELLEM